MRILHLLDSGSPGVGATLLRLAAEPLSRIRSIEHVAIVVGNEQDVALAERCGVPVAGRIPAPLRRPLLGRRALRSTLEHFREAGRGVDLIHTWSADSLLAALSIAPDVRLLATLPIGPVAGLSTTALALALEQRPAALTALTPQIASEFGLAGIADDRIRVIEPAVNPGMLAGRDAARHALRQRWGAGSRTLVLGLLAEPPRWSDARLGATIATIVALAGYEVKLVTHSSAMRRSETHRWLRDAELEEILVVEDQLAEPWSIVHGLDAALVLGADASSDDLHAMGGAFSWLVGGGRQPHPSPSVMPMLWAIAAGVPVVAEATSSFASILTDGVNGLLVNAGDVNAAADRLIRLADDRQLAGRIGAAATALAASRFHVSAFCVRLKELYLEVASGDWSAPAQQADPDVAIERRGAIPVH